MTVHIDLVHSISTDSFVLGLFNFINRRGNIKIMFGDRAKNSVGSQMELIKKSKDSEEGIREDLLRRDMESRLIPPQPSHRGLWGRFIAIRK